jgi:ABC-type sugar transport system permease subunit
VSGFRQARRRGLLFVVPYGASFTAFIVLPIVVALVLAFMQFDLTSRESIKFIGWRNFQEALADKYFWMAMKATVSYVVLMVPSLIVSSLAVALGMNAMSHGRSSVRALLFLPGMLNVAVSAILWRWFYEGEFGLLNYYLKHLGFQPLPWLSDVHYAMPSIVLMSLWWVMGGTSVILLTALQQIPKQIVEAAVLDGAVNGRLFFRVLLPQLRPVLLFVVITNTIAGFQVFGQPLLLTNGGPELATRGVVQYIYEQAFSTYRLGYGAAMSWLLFAVIAVLAIGQYQLFRRAVS